jgi:zinc and cadmium transporter
MLTEALWPSLAALIVMLISLSGILFTAGIFRDFLGRNLIYLATFSGGVFLLVTYNLLEETLHESGSFALTAGAVLLGSALLQALHHILPDMHHHHNTEHDHIHTSIDGRRVLIGDAFHNVGDGFLLVAAFAVSWPIGISASIGIIIHELVQEISEYFVLREAGYTGPQALARNFISSSTILFGVFIALFLSSAEEISVLFAGIAAGGFVTILAQDLLPHTITSVRQRGGAWKHLLAFTLGITLMMSVQSLFPLEESVVGTAASQISTLQA